MSVYASFRPVKNGFAFAAVLDRSAEKRYHRRSRLDWPLLSV